MNHNIQILDCTLRDGGLGLEDAYKNKLSRTVFQQDDIDKIALHLQRSGIDIIELGSIEPTDQDKRQFAIYQDISAVSMKIPAEHGKNQMYVGLFRGPDMPVEDIPERTEHTVDGLRVIIRYSELQKSLDFCSELSKKGYKVFVQPMLTMRYTEDELDLIIRESNKMNAYALYFVDSYGYMQDEDVSYFLDKYDKGLEKDIKIGFHAHNNMNLAYSNALHFINSDIDRGLICDACAIGMGQGAGNLQTELIVPYINNYVKEKYNFSEILNVCEIIEQYFSDSIWGYSVTRLLPALHKTAYKYAISLRKHYNLSFSEINELFSKMPEDLRHRYTAENTEKLLLLSKNASQ